MSICDDGMGLPAPGLREGVGLTNSRERLQHRFGDRALLRLGPREGGGTEVLLRLPPPRNEGSP